MVLAALWVANARAQNPPYTLFQSSTLSGSGNTISVTQLPVVTSGGISYKNVSLLFDVDSQGNLTLASGYPIVTTPTRPLVSAFKAGTYVGPPTILGGKAVIVVSGPSVGPGGSTEWSLTSASGADPCTYPDTAVWYAVQTLANSPLAARLKSANITSNMSSYGVGRSQCTTDGFDWEQNTLLGFSQSSGNSLVVSSYTYNGQTDSNIPKDTITYTLKTP